MKKITIVTAFFPINRGNWEHYARSNQKYFDYFEFWSRIKNDMVIYTSKECKKNIEEIRIKKFGRKNTKIIVIDDYTKIDEEIYNMIKSTMNTELQRQYKICNKNPESSNADYNYTTNIKSWFVKDAVEKKYASGMVAWVDFGFNHGGEVYTNKNDFDFEWEYKFEDKITLFNLYDLDDLPMFEIIRSMHSYIQGSVMIAPDYLWEEFYKLSRESIKELYSLGISDDDQTISLMAYRKNKSLFNMIKLDRWHMMFKYYSNHDFEVSEIKKQSFIDKIKIEIYYKKNVIRHCRFWYKVLMKDRTKS